MVKICLDYNNVHWFLFRSKTKSSKILSGNEKYFLRQAVKETFYLTYVELNV